MSPHAGAGYDSVLMFEEMDIAGQLLLIGAPASLANQRGDLTRQGGDEDWTLFGRHDDSRIAMRT